MYWKHLCRVKKSHNKWSDISKVVNFLCHSTLHARSVTLVLNTQTGNVSPQFHCLFDTDFNTCKCNVKFQSIWQHKAKLHTYRKPTPYVPSPAQPYMSTIKKIELALDIPDHLSHLETQLQPHPNQALIHYRINKL